MKPTRIPRAPFDLKAKLMTALFFGIIIVIMASVDGLPARVGIAAFLLLATGLFYVRGYTLRDDALLIHQLLWTRRLPLAQLEAASHDPGLLVGSIRTFGIGGVFGYIGLFRSPPLGTYTAYLSAGQYAVILRFGERTIAISPADPAAFLQLLAEHPAVHLKETAA